MLKLTHEQLPIFNITLQLKIISFSLRTPFLSSFFPRINKKDHTFTYIRFRLIYKSTPLTFFSYKIETPSRFDTRKKYKKHATLFAKVVRKMRHEPPLNYSSEKKIALQNKISFRKCPKLCFFGKCLWSVVVFKVLKSWFLTQELRFAIICTGKLGHGYIIIATAFKTSNLTLSKSNSTMKNLWKFH